MKRPELFFRWDTRRHRLRIVWTCCDVCHTDHRNKVTAWLHWCWLRLARRA